MRDGRIVRVAVGALVVLGCKGSSSPSTPSPAPAAVPGADNDRLLALAPSGTTAAVVASARAIDLAWGAVVRARAVAKDDVGARAVSDQLDTMLGEQFGLRPGDSLARLGFAADRGLARFQLGPDRTVTIWPVGDRAAFVRAFHGQSGTDGVDVVTVGGEESRCRPVMDVYACATDVRDLDRLGTGSLAGRPAHAGARGDVELVATPEEDGEPVKELALTVALEPGQLLMRGKVIARLPPDVAAQAGERVSIDGSTASGLAGVAVAPSTLAAFTQLEPPVGPLAAELDGRMTMVAPSGVADLDVRIGFRRTDTVRALLDHCDQFPLPEGFTVRRAGDACVVGVGGAMQFTATVWLDGNTLRISRERAPVAAATGPGPGPIGRELAGQPWNFVFWGRGTSLTAPGTGPLGSTVLTSAFAYLNEVGLGARIDDDGASFVLGARTVFANPPAVVDAVPKLIARVNEGHSVAADVRLLAAANPTSAFAGDVDAGPIGLTVPTGAIGILSAVAIPMFLDYMKVEKRSEAELNLDAIGKAADAEYVDKAEFPVATAPLTPSTPCCAQPGHQCAPRARDWQGVAAWDALGFEMTQPHYFQYAYASDGRTFHATAVGDLDCDGISVTYQLDGEIGTDGAPHHTLHKPARAD